MRIYSAIRLAPVLAILLHGAAAFGSQGQLGIEPVAVNELGILYHPAAGYQNAQGSFEYLPRFGLNLVYGLRNHWDISLGCEASLQRQVTARNVNYQKVSSGDLYASYNDILIPAKVTYRLDVGRDLGFVGALTIGAALVQWRDRYMLPANSNDGPGAQPYFINKTNRWYTGVFGRAAVGGEWSPTDWFTLTLAPYFAYASNRNMGVGINVGADFKFGFGGLWDPV